MTIEDMHLDFLRKLNKVTSNQNRSFLIPETDLILNEAQTLYVKRIAEPRMINPITGFERSQRNRDDIRTLVIGNYSCNITDNIVEIPEDYMFYVKAKVIMSNEHCSKVKGNFFLHQHDDMFEDSPFNNSSFEWREVTGTFIKEGIELYPEGFTVDEFLLTYIKKPVYMHYADGFRNGSYYLPDGVTLLSGKQDCELPEHTHSEIVDLAVLLTVGDIASPEFQLKMAKLKFNDII